MLHMRHFASKPDLWFYLVVRGVLAPFSRYILPCTCNEQFFHGHLTRAFVEHKVCGCHELEGGSSFCKHNKDWMIWSWKASFPVFKRCCGVPYVNAVHVASSLLCPCNDKNYHTSLLGKYSTRWGWPYSGLRGVSQISLSNTASVNFIHRTEINKKAHCLVFGLFLFQSPVYQWC